MTSNFERSVIDLGFRNTNYKGQRDLSEDQQRQPESELVEHLNHWGYPLSFAEGR